MNTTKSFFLRAIIFGISLIIIFSIFAIGSKAQGTPAISLTKNADVTTFSSVGLIINYTYNIQNIGDVILAGPVVVSDDKVDVACPAVNSTGNHDEYLDPQEVLLCTASYTITQADLDTGLVTNKATATAGGINSNEATASATAEQTPGLTVVKSADPISFSSAGETISYSFVVTNSGNVTLDGPFTIDDDKAIDEDCPVTATLAPGGDITCTASYTITQADLNAGSVTNNAYATGSFGGNPVTSLTDDKTINASQDTTLTLAKAAEPTSYDSIDDVIDYSYTLTNNGNVVLSGPFTVTDNKATVTCPSTTSLDPGNSITCTATYTIKQADLNAGSVTNTAVGHAFFAGSPVDSNEDSETVQATLSPKITLTKTSTETSYKAVGNVLNYQLTAKNDGNVTLTNVMITDLKFPTLTCDPPGQGGSLAPLASLSCTGTYTIIQADLIAKSVTNTADSSGKLGATTIPSNTASHTVYGATFTVDPTSGLLTDENGTTDTFTIKLDKKPSADVVLELKSLNPDEADVSPTTLTFKPNEWSPSQTKTVTVQGKNDNIADGAQPFTVTITNKSSGPDYSGVNPPPVTGTNGDNDTAGITVSPLSDLVTTEGKTSAKIQIKLNTQPTANVTVSITIPDQTKRDEVTIFPTSLIIKPNEWNQVREVTVTGVDDKVPDGDQSYLINISTTNYFGKGANVNATNRDAPTINWISPVGTGQIYEIDNLVPFLLKVVKDGTEPITRVRFYRWDAVKIAHVSIGEIQVSPYQMFYDPALIANKLNPGFNQFFAVAYNGKNVASDNVFIWVYKQGGTYTLYLPIVIRD